MPGQEYLQFLTPQRAGEQVPDSQINTAGPFSAELAQPYVRRTQVPEPGFGGPGHALLSFANKFLEGASEGRLRQFQQSEQTKKEHERNFDATVQHIQNDPGYTKEFKEQVLQSALAAKAGAGQAVLGKGGKDAHPAAKIAQAIFTGLVGPHDNKAHVDIGPEHVSDLISQMHDPANKFDMAGTVASTQGQLNQALQDIQAEGKARGVDITREDAMAHPKVIAALQPLMKQGYDAYTLPPIQAALSALPGRMTPAQQAELATAHARQAMYEGKQSGLWTYTNPDGTEGRSMLAFKPDASGTMKPYFALTGLPIPAGHPILTTGQPAQQQNTTLGNYFYTDADQNLVRVPTTTVHVKGPPPAGSAPAGTPAPPVDAGVIAPIPNAPAGAAAVPTPIPNAPVGAPTVKAPGPFQPIIAAAANRNGLDANLFSAVIAAESNFNPAAVSPKGAQGLTQLMPDTAKAMGVQDPMNPEQNVEGGARYLKQLLIQYGGDVRKALTAYNFGPGNLESGKAIPQETKDYVDKVIRNSNAANPLPTAPAQVEKDMQAGRHFEVAPGRGATPPPPIGQIVGQKAKPFDADLTMTQEQGAKLRTDRAANISLDKDAWDYLLGDRPFVRGMGKDVQPQIKRIKQTAGQIAADMGLDVGDLMARSAAIKGNRAAFSRVAVQASQIRAFEGMLLKNAALAQDLSSKFKRGDIQIFNRVAEAFKTGKGDQEALNLAGQLHTLTTEWAKVMAGATSAAGVPVTSQEKAEALVSKGISDGQLEGFINSVMVPDAHNRTASNKEELEGLLGAIGDATKPKAAAAAAGATAPPPTANPNPNAYIPGHVYGGMMYGGGDPKLGTSWKKVAAK